MIYAVSAGCFVPGEGTKQKVRHVSAPNADAAARQVYRALAREPGVARVSVQGVAEVNPHGLAEHR